MAELSAKQRAYIENRASGMTSIDAARAAGYKHPDSAAAWLRRHKGLAEYNRNIAERLGMDDEAFIQKVINGMEATRTVVVRDKAGVTTFEEPDSLAQVKFVKIMAELTGMIPPPESRVQGEGSVRVKIVKERAVTDPELITLSGQALLDALLKRAERRRLG